MLSVVVPAACCLALAGPWIQGNYKLSGPLTAPPSVAGDVEDARLSPDGRRIVYLARQDDPAVAELYSVPRDGSSPAVKLSGTLADGGAIDDYAIGPDGLWVVYQADQEQVSVHELFSVPIDGSASPTRLSTPSASFAHSSYQISPDGRRVVFFDTLDLRLRVVSIQGGSARALHALRPGGFVLGFQFSPDGERILFTADPDGRSGLNLFSAPVDVAASEEGHARKRSSRPVRLNAPLAPGTDIFSFRIGPSGRAVYQVVGGNFDLFGVPIDGRTRAVRLNPAPVPGGHVTYGGYEVSPDGERVLYRADQETDDVHELYSVPIDGGASAVKLNAPLIAEGDVAHPGFAIAPDGSRVVYLADQEVDGVPELYAVPIDASASPLKLSPTPDELSPLVSFRIGPYGERVVCLAAGDCGVSRLFSVPLDCSTGPVELDRRSGGPCGGEEEYAIEYEISPDGSHVVYLADEHVDGGVVRELFSVSIDGGEREVAKVWRVHHVAPVRLNTPLPPGGNVGVPSSFTFAISADGAEVVYRAGQESASVLELFCVPIDGTAPPRKLNPELALGPPPGDVVDAEISPDGGFVVYRTDRAFDEQFELFCVPIAGGGLRQTRLAGALHSGSSVESFAIAAGVGRVVHLSRVEGSVRLYSTPLDGGAEALELSGPLAAGGNVLDFHLSPDGRLVAYVADQAADGVAELFSVPTDGSSSPVRLSAQLPPGGSVLACASQLHPHAHFTGDGERLLYLADQDRDQVFELFSVVSNGSAPPVRINAPLAAGGDVAAFATCFLIGHGRVVYLADQDTNEVYELYSAPLDGSAAPVKLSGPLAPGGDVSVAVDGVPLDPMGELVVYRADQEVDERFELFSVPIDGSAAPVRLNGPPIAAGDVSPHAPGFSPDGTRVLYRADQEHDGRFDLYSVPLRGGGQVVRLSSLPFHSRHVEEFEIDPSGRRVVYRADQDTDQVFELYGVPIDGGAPAQRLLDPGSRVDAFRIAADGEQVVFAAALGSPGRSLWSVSIHGNELPVLLGGPMAGAGVRTDAAGISISPTGRHAVYLADQETAGVQELYAALLSRPRIRRH